MNKGVDFYKESSDERTFLSLSHKIEMTPDKWLRLSTNTKLCTWLQDLLGNFSFSIWTMPYKSYLLSIPSNPDPILIS